MNKSIYALACLLTIFPENIFSSASTEKKHQAKIKQTKEQKQIVQEVKSYLDEDLADLVSQYTPSPKQKREEVLSEIPKHPKTERQKELANKLFDFASKGDIKGIQELEKIPDFNINAINSYGGNALWSAINMGHKYLVNYLLNKGINPNLKIAKLSKNTLLIEEVIKAVKDEHKTDFPLEAVRNISTLMRYGANPNLVNKHGSSALSFAAYFALDKKIAEQQGSYPRRYFSYKRMKPIINLLLFDKADPNIGISFGFTPLAGAIAEQNEDLVNLLLNYGANFNDPNLLKEYHDNPKEFGFSPETEKKLLALTS